MPSPGQRVRGRRVWTPASLSNMTALLGSRGCTKGEGRTLSLDMRTRGKLMQRR